MGVWLLMKRRRILLIVVPVFLALVVGVITTLSLPFYSLGPERISIYDTSYEVPDFNVDDVRVKYFDADELTVWFYISGNKEGKDLRFEFICRNENGDLIEAGGNGNIVIEAVNYPEVNSTDLITGDLVMGVLEWPDVPVGDLKIKAVIDLDWIAVETESFHIELRQLN